MDNYEEALKDNPQVFTRNDISEVYLEALIARLEETGGGEKVVEALRAAMEAFRAAPLERNFKHLYELSGEGDE